jgi:carbamoylphosphate synthase large subunit
MKKILVFIFAINSIGVSSAASIEQYANSVDKIRGAYAQDIRSFLRSLNPQTSQFTSEQQAKYCQINQRYIQDMSDAIEKNRSSLPAQYASMSKQDLIKQVVESKEMQMLAKYNVQCEFK